MPRKHPRFLWSLFIFIEIKTEAGISSRSLICLFLNKKASKINRKTRQNSKTSSQRTKCTQLTEYTGKNRQPNVLCSNKTFNLFHNLYYVQRHVTENCFGNNVQLVICVNVRSIFFLPIIYKSSIIANYGPSFAAPI